MATKDKDNGSKPTEGEAAKPASNELVTQRGPSALAVKEEVAIIDGFANLGVDIRTIKGQEVQSGGVAKWLDLSEFQVDPNTPSTRPVEGNGKFFQGLLIGRSEMPAKGQENAEMNDDGEPVRHYYTIRLAAPCPVTIKDDNNVSVKAMAQAGDVVNIGERHQLRILKPWTEDGGLYAVVIQPHSRIKIGGGHCMWTFRVKQYTIRQPVKAILQKAPAPF